MGNYMENYREEMAAEITTKVVHSLGIVIDNKLAVLLDRKAEAKVDESDFAKKVRKDKVKVKKVKTEAMRMTMELGEESLESKELKKLKKSLIKKTDKVVKVAMKIEKKNHQEQKGRKASLSSCCNSEQLQALKLSEKKEKKAPKVKEEKKAKDEKKTKKSKPKKDIVEKDDEENVIKAGAGVDTDKDCVPVVTCQPRQRGPEVVLPNLEDQGDSDDLPAALLLPNGSPTIVGQAGKILKMSVPIVNLGCAACGEEPLLGELDELPCHQHGLAAPAAWPGGQPGLPVHGAVHLRRVRVCLALLAGWKEVWTTSCLCHHRAGCWEEGRPGQGHGAVGLLEQRWARDDQPGIIGCCPRDGRDGKLSQRDSEVP